MAVSNPSLPNIAMAPVAGPGIYEKLNTRWHERALQIFMVIVLGHWAEHLVQAYQIYVMGWPRPKALGLLGLYYPWLIKTEALHYGYALVMLIGLWVLRKGFTGVSRKWWTIALVIQFWHHIEHFLLIWRRPLTTTFGTSLCLAAFCNSFSPELSSIFSTTQLSSSLWLSPCTITCSRPRTSRDKWHAPANGGITGRRVRDCLGLAETEQRKGRSVRRSPEWRVGRTCGWLGPRRHRKLLVLANATILLIFGCSIFGCSRRVASVPVISIGYEITPQPAKIGPATVAIKLSDAAMKPVTGARVTLEADMSHPGMAPAFGEAQEVAPGRYQGRLEFSMAGDWVVQVHVTLPSGQQSYQQIEVRVVRPN